MQPFSLFGEILPFIRGHWDPMRMCEEGLENPLARAQTDLWGRQTRQSQLWLLCLLRKLLKQMKSCAWVCECMGVWVNESVCVCSMCVCSMCACECVCGSQCSALFIVWHSVSPWAWSSPNRWRDVGSGDLSTCFCLRSAEIEDVGHHTELPQVLMQQ